MKRLTNILGIVVTTTLLSVGIASAASLSFGTSTLGANSTTVAGCTSTALTATRNVNNSGNVTQLNVTNVPQACAGELLAATLENGMHASLGGSTAIVGTCTGGCTVSLTGFGTVSAALVKTYAFSLTQ